jgi:hypothetical protein
MPHESPQENWGWTQMIAAARPVICEVKHSTQIWKTLVRQHHFY